jgi:hypothetical protein
LTSKKPCKNSIPTGPVYRSGSGCGYDTPSLPPYNDTIPLYNFSMVASTYAFNALRFYALAYAKSQVGQAKGASGLKNYKTIKNVISDSL